jgi:hypothetical protein
MNKGILKILFSRTVVGEELVVNFIPQYKQYSGKYKITLSKVGRGKSGSRVVELQHLETGEKLTRMTIPGGEQRDFGTAVSDIILNVTHNGVMYGDTDTTTPNAYPRSPETSELLKSVFDALISKHEGQTLLVKSSEPEFDGKWTFVSGRVIPGRHGQRILTLKRGNETRELWSYRHSGIVSEISLVE